MTGIKPLYLAVEFLLNYYISCQPVQSTFPQTNHVSLLYSCIFSSMITRSKKMTRKQRTEGHRYSLSCLMQTCKTVAIDTKYQCKQNILHVPTTRGNRFTSAAVLNNYYYYC